MKDTLHRLYNESPILYLLRVKEQYHPRNEDHKVYLPEINKAFNDFLKLHPSRALFESVVYNLVLTSSMLWDIMHYNEKE